MREASLPSLRTGYESVTSQCKAAISFGQRKKNPFWKKAWTGWSVVGLPVEVKTLSWKEVEIEKLFEILLFFIEIILAKRR